MACLIVKHVPSFLIISLRAFLKMHDYPCLRKVADSVGAVSTYCIVQVCFGAF